MTSGLAIAVLTGAAVADAPAASAAVVPVDPAAAVIARTASIALGALDRGDRLGFVLARAEVALVVAAGTAVAPTDLVAAWDRAGDLRTGVVLTALTQLGTPYRHNSSTPGVGFDCSGLTSFAWRAAAGVELPRQSEGQLRAGRVVAADDALAGDIVHYPGHVMLYLGVPGALVHAPYTGRSVELYRTPGRSVRYVDPID